MSIPGRSRSSNWIPCAFSRRSDGLTERLRAGTGSDDDGFSGFLGLRLRDVATHAPVFVDPGSTVGEAARRMREQRVGSVLVTGEPAGILTERDLSARVLAAGLGPDTPVHEVITAPVLTVPPETPVLEALLFLSERGIRHLPLRDETGIFGFVSATDLVRLQARDPLSLLRRLQGGRLDVAHYREEILQTVDRLAKGGIGAVAIARLIASMTPSSRAFCPPGSRPHFKTSQQLRLSAIAPKPK